MAALRTVLVAPAALLAVACLVPLTSVLSARAPSLDALAPVCADAGSGCSVCAACCHSFIPAGKSCAQCVAEKCPAPQPVPLIIDTDIGGGGAS